MTSPQTHAMRWTVAALAATGIVAVAEANVPLPKPRPIARHVATAALQTAAPALLPATRQHSVPAPRKPAVTAAMAASSSTPQADMDAVENVIELLRKGKAGDASQAVASIGDPVARKLAEWIYLRADNNGATVERYRAFVAANPSWPSQTFMRRRAEAALWDDNRDDAAVLGYFASEKPVSGKGRLSYARALLARGDRAAAERQVRDAWRSDAMSGDTEEAALEAFGSLLSGGDHKARMDLMLYGSEQDSGLRAARRLGGGHLVLAKARNAVYRKAPNARAMLDAVPHDLRGDPGYIHSRIQPAK